LEIGKFDRALSRARWLSPIPRILLVVLLVVLVLLPLLLGNEFQFLVRLIIKVAALL
jgi:hypothetical protein